MKTKPPDTKGGPMVDTHAHIRDAAFDADREPVLKRAQAAGVSAVVAESEILNRLRGSAFRNRFQLGAPETAYVRERGLDRIRAHARRFITERLAPAHPERDGKQTPMKGHPVFMAQHATATCCRKCLHKWHGIEPGRPLSETEVAHVVAVIMGWIEREMEGRWGPEKVHSESGRQLSLFEA